DERCPRVPLRVRAVVHIVDIVAADRRHIVDGHARHRRGNPRAGPGRVELGDAPRAAAAAADVIPEAVASGAERRDDTDPGNDDAGHVRARHGDWDFALLSFRLRYVLMLVL